MGIANNDTAFTRSVAQLYESHLVPLIFEPYAADMARRVAERRPARVLEIAAGTGVVTRKLAAALGGASEIIATDLNASMLDEASRIGTASPVTWRQADAMQLPFEDGSFDVACCQFGAMFFPDKARAFAEARRVLRPGGVFLFSVWDTLATNAFADAVTDACAALFPEDPPRFLARTPHGYGDPARIAEDTAAAGFTAPPATVETIAFTSRAASARIPAVAYCHGSVLRTEIEARDASGLERATHAAEAELTRRFGEGPIEGAIQAHVVTATR